jgi:hypothetical protein
MKKMTDTTVLMMRGTVHRERLRFLPLRLDALLLFDVLLLTMA